ncbi:ABC transporter permease [Bosea vestrisii]|uniref:ABC transporter permease n=1 Tax=Bosea vestrisii TaxID=151416 RepID=A0ABW0HC65_9HYPH
MTTARVETRGSQQAQRGPAWLGETLGYLRRNPSMIVGGLLLLALVLFTGLGRLIVDTNAASPLSAPPAQPPGPGVPLGSDPQGRDILCVMILGTWLTVRTGLVAGALGVAVGSAIGLYAGYVGGRRDKAITWVVDVLLTVPAILLLVMIAAVVQTELTSLGMALIIAALAWRRPARQVRSQMLVIRNAGYIEMARLSGLGPLGIIFGEIVPNLLPFLISSFVTAVSAAILAGVGLEAMGLGPQNEPTLGMTIFWIMELSAFLRGMWWWIVPPLAILVVLFVGLYLVNAGLDELANPRLRRRA